MLSIQPSCNSAQSNRVHDSSRNAPSRADGTETRFDKFIRAFKNVSGSVAAFVPVAFRAWANPASAHFSGGLDNVCGPTASDRRMAAEGRVPDKYAMHWDGTGSAFLKVKGGYVKLRQDVSQDNLFFYRGEGRRHEFVLKNNRLYPLTTAQHLHKIRVIGLSGRGAVRAARTSLSNRTAVDIVRKVMNADAESAQRYLAQYRFEKFGPHSEMQFALHLEQCGKRPEWAETFRKRPLPGRADEQSCGTPQKKTARGGFDVTQALGTLIGGGVRGIVYRDKNDDAFVIKRIKRQVSASNDEATCFPCCAGAQKKWGNISFARRLRDAEEEAALFCRYYGEAAAEVHFDEHDVYIRMRLVPGLPIRSVSEFPQDAVERFTDMLGFLNAAGIMHQDLHCGNVLYDPVGKRFYPVDLSNMKERYFRTDALRRYEFNLLGDYLWHVMTEEIEKRMPAGSRQTSRSEAEAADD